MKANSRLILVFVLLCLTGCPVVVVDNDYDNIVVVKNFTDEYIYFVYLSPCSADYWGENFVYDYPLAPNQDLIIYNVQDGCYDFYAENYDGDYWEIYNIWISGGETYEIFLSYKSVGGKSVPEVNVFIKKE